MKFRYKKKNRGVQDLNELTGPLTVISHWGVNPTQGLTTILYW